ncbi:MAG TPA: hypothetical protein DCG36_10090 [Alteromonas macleodii]|nr:hypothetical protein [Alteromonas macleodii]
MRQSSELAANAIMAIATNTKVFNKPNLPSFKRKNAQQYTNLSRNASKSKCLNARDNILQRRRQVKLPKTKKRTERSSLN